MSFSPLDPNRFVSGVEALSVQSRVEIEQMEVELATKRGALANQTLRTVQHGFLEAAAVYKMHQARMAEAIAYKKEAERQLAASIARLSSTKAPLHPNRKTPPEVLGLIFEFCLEDLPPYSEESQLPASIKRRQLQPFQLARVCRRWRQASLSWPRAWRTIDIRIDKTSVTDQQKWVDYVALILQRSATAALNIHIFRPAPPDAVQPARVVARLLDGIHRCTVLLISTDVIANGNDIIVPLLKAKTPVLHDLHLLLSKPGERGFLQSLSAFPHAPMLWKIRGSFPAFAYGAPFPALQRWVQLDPIVATDRDDVARILSLCPRVYDLGLDFNTNGVARSLQDDTKIVDNNVRVLRVTSGIDGEHLALFASRYSFAGITALILHGSQATSAQRARYLQDIAPLSPLLRELWFQHLGANDVDLLGDALRGAPALSFLGFRDCALDDVDDALRDAFGSPRSDQDGSWLCPALTILYFDQSCTITHCRALDKLLELVQRRNHAAKNNQGVCCLRQVTFPPTVYQEAKERIAQCLLRPL